MTPVVQIKNLAKSFGAFSALKGVSIDIYPGEVHALLGDNGAGKSTLIKILSGVFLPTSGEVEIDAKPVHFRTPRDATNSGIGTVYQDLALAPLMSVARNFFLGRELFKGPSYLGILDDVKMEEIATAELRKIGNTSSTPRQTVNTMSGGQRQTLAIARAIYFGARVLILDEPTSALGQIQQMEVLKTIARVRARGDIAIILITHNEVHAKLVADRFTFLSLGEVIGKGTRTDLAGEEIRHLMAGGAEIADLEKEINAISSS
jgi:simple sugar transport system ATP-binding protein